MTSKSSQVLCGAGVPNSLQTRKGLMGTWWDSNHHPRPQMVVCFVFAAEGPTPVPLLLVLVWVGSRQRG